MSEFQKYLDKQFKKIVLEENNDQTFASLVKEIGAEITKARTTQNITQKELAIKTGINQATISKLESGEGNPSTKLLLRVARALNKKISIKVE